MAGTKPLENRAWVIASYDSRFIRTLPDIPPDTEKVYYVSMALKVPEGTSPGEAARRIVEGEMPKEPEFLGYKKVHIFTSKLEDAMRFEKSKLDEELEQLRFEVKARLRSECLNEEFVPF